MRPSKPTLVFATWRRDAITARRWLTAVALLSLAACSIGADGSGSSGPDLDGLATPKCKSSDANTIGGMAGKVLDVRTGSTVQLYAATGSANQQLTIMSDRTIRTADGRCLGVASTDSGTPVEINDCDGGSNQEWEIQPTGEIIGVGSGKCLDAAGASTADGTPINIYDCWGPGAAANQIWTTCEAAQSEPPQVSQACADGHPLCVSANHRYLKSANGKPFVYIADLAWLLFVNNLSEAAIEDYLKTRASQGFNVVEAVLVSQWNCGSTVPCPGLNRNGVRPIDDWKPTSSTKPLNETFFQWVDWVISRAEAHGLYVGIVATDAIHTRTNPFNTDSAYDYGRRLGLRYRDRKNIIWISGGDSSSRFNIHAALIRGIRSADTNHLVTYHPGGSGIGSISGVGTSQGFPDGELLDFNQFQTVCTGGCANRRIQTGTVPAIHQSLAAGKPIVNGEALVEGVSQYQTQVEVRNTTYWTLFGGGAGYAYLATPAMYFGYKNRPWGGLDLPGASQLKYAKNLMLSRPGYFGRVNDQALVNDANPYNAIALRAADRSYAFVYVAGASSVSVDLSKMSSNTAAVSWFNPRTGAISSGGTRTGNGSVTLATPSNADWVLVLDAQ